MTQPFHLAFFLLITLLAACNDKPADGTVENPGDLTVTPGSLQITILSPALDGNSLSSYSVISGDCGIPGNPIVVSGGGVSLYSICQNDYSWSAPITGVSSPEGSVQFSAALKDKNLASSSPVALRSFIKRDGICLDPINRGKLFANFGVADGDTTPYKICTPTQFANIRHYPAKKFLIAQDIDFAEMTVPPIAVAFTGEIDGQGFILKDLVVKDIGGTGTSVGLFRYIQNAKIRNLNIKNIFVEGNQRVGILAGDWRGTGLIENCKFQGSVKAITMAGGLIGLGNTTSALTLRNIKTQVQVNANNYSGGVVGYINTNDGSLLIENSNFNSDVTGNSWTGGIAGQILEDNTTFTNVFHRGHVSSLTEKVGGLVGEVNGGTFTNISHTGTVSTTKDNVDTFVGGLFGLTTKAATINGATVVSTISSGGNYTGGLVGRFYSGSITGAIARVTVNVDDNQFQAPQKFAGGLLGGTNADTSIADSHAVVVLNTKAYYVGGLVGNLNGANSSIQRSWTSGEINGRVSHIGGLVGNFTGSSVSQSFSRANLTVGGTTPNSYLGGLIGFTNNAAATFSRLYHSGNITITDGTPDMVGGIFGYVKALSVKQAYASGNIMGPRSRVGGIAGYLWAPLSESFFTGTISANLRYVGGLAGVAYQSKLTDNFVQSALIQGSGEVGGLTGWLVEGNAAEINRGYFTGTIRKNAASTLDDVTFGAVTGLKDTNATTTNVSFDSSSSFTRLSDAQALARNSLGLSLSSSSLRNQSSYTGFNFETNETNYNWQMPLAGFKLPFRSQNFIYAIHDWLTEVNQGFVLPVNYTNDPVNEVQPEIFDPLQTILSSYSQDEFDVITATTSPSSVTVGQLQISFLSPASDGNPIATKMLIHGECGVPGGKVSLTGSFIVNTICQSNYRWSAIIDASTKAPGNLPITAKLSNLAQTATSPSVTRILNKHSSLCTDPQAMSGLFANSHLGGNGTTVPFKICHVGHLRNLAYQPNAVVELANDIDFGGNSFDPIITSFKGSLDGKNFRLRNLVINKSSGTTVGLFASAQNATLKNIVIEKFSITGNDRVGLFAGDWRGTGVIENVTLKNGTITGIVSTGGLVGLANTVSALQINGLTLQNVTVNGNNHTGGVIGYLSTADGSFSAQNVTLTNLTVNGLGNVGGINGISAQPNMNLTNITATGLKVTGLSEKIGGLVGNIHSASMNNINLTGELNAPKDAVEISAGGIVGEATHGLVLNNVRWMGPVSSGSDNVGGIVGKVTNLTANNMVSSGVLTINDDKYNSVRKNIGGLTGLILGEASSVQNSSSTMTLNAISQFTGGLFGRFEGENAVIKNCYFSGTVNARTSYVGGLAGIFDGKDLWDSYNTGAVNVTNPTPNANIGGLLGYANSQVSNYKRLRAGGPITISSGLADYVGGLIGFFRGGTLEDSYATGNITGARIAVGGLIGMMRGTVQRSFATGNVSASSRHVGGLVGYLNLQGIIRDSFSIGNVLAGDEAGGLVGHINTIHGQVAVHHSYAFGQVTSLGGTLANFGPVIGTTPNTAQIDGTSLFYLSSKLTSGHNTLGSGLSQSSSSQQNSYTNFDFSATPGWRIPAAATNVPGHGANFPYPILDWIGEGSSSTNYEIRGTIAGLQYSSVTLSLNGGEDVITVNAPTTSFVFNQRLEAGQNYAVTITSQPSSPALTCALVNDSGVMGNASVTNIALSCPTFQSLAISALANMPTGGVQAVTVNGTLTNSVVVNLTAFATLTSSNTTNFSLANGNLTALTAGTTTLSTSFLNLNASQTVAAQSAPTAPTNPAWQGTSPSTIPLLTTTWTRSAAAGVVSQRVDYFTNGVCSGSPISSKTIGQSASSDTFTGTDDTTYSFKVTAIDSNALSSASACSNTMLVNLPAPSPVSSLTASTLWINGNSPVTSPVYSWVNPANITGIEIALGNTVGGAEVKAWNAIGNITSYSLTNLSTLSNCTLYYASLRAVNQYNKKSSATIHTAGFKWDNGQPSSPGSITTSGSASSSVTKIATWGASSDNCQLNSYELAFGTTAGGTDISGGWKNIGNVVSYQATSGAGGFNFTLQAGTTYYTSVRAKDQAGNYSNITTSAGWQMSTTSLAKVFWYDASDRTSVKDPNGKTPDEIAFTGKVRTWEDKATSLDAYSPAATNDPGYESTKNQITFSGTSQYFRLPSTSALDSSTSTFKNFFVSFQTSVDLTTRQVIYEQGTNTRGLNLYLFNGKLYCGFWNTSNDGDGAQAILSTSSATNLSPNTNYHAAVIFDYTNFTNASGPNGSVKCFLNNTQMGSTLSTTSRLYSHASSAAWGATYGGTRYHDSNTTATGSYFRGKILEAFMYASHPSAAEISSALNALMAKWSSGELAAPGNLALMNNSTLTKAATATWSPISSSYFETHHYEIALGTSLENTDILFWTDIGNVTTYTAEDGVGGLSFDLEYGVDYYLMVKAVDIYGNESLTSTSESWRVLPPGSTLLAGTFLNLDASYFASVADGANVMAGQTGFANLVSTWKNKINTAINNFIQTTAASQPTFSTNLKSAIFDRTNDFMSTPAETNLGNSTVTAKVVTMVFSTNTDVTTRQFLFELGDRSRGLAIYIEGGQLYCLFQQSTNGGDGAQAAIWKNTAVTAGTSYIVTLYLNYTNYTNASGPNGAFGCAVNGTSLGTSVTTSRWYATNNPAYLGYRNSARWHNSNSTGAGDYFGGEIHELQMTNSWPTDGLNDITTLQTNLMNKW